MLSIKDLHVSVEDKAILRGLSPSTFVPAKFTPLWGPMVRAKVPYRQRLPGEKIMK